MKKSRLLLLSSFMVLGLVACGTSEASSSVASSNSDASETTSVESASSSDAPASSSETPASSSNAPASSSDAPTSSSNAPASSSSSAPASSSSSSQAPVVGPVDVATLTAKADAYNRAAIRATNKIATGDYKITTNNSYMEEPQTTVGTYKFDDEKAYYHNQNYTIFVDTYVFYDDGKLIGYEIADGDPARPASVTEDNLSGVDFSYNAGFNPALINIYGAEAYLNNAYAYAKSNKNGDLQGELTENGYKLSFLNAYDGGYGFIDYKFVSIEAEFDAKSNILSHLKVTTDSYAQESMEVGTTASIKEGEKPNETKILEVNQTTGERSVVPPYQLSQFIFTAFNLYDGDDHKIENNATYTTELGEWGTVELYYKDVAPASASTAFDSIVIECDDPSFQYGNAREGVISMSFSSQGTYQVKISTKNVSYNITVVATAPLPTAMEVYEMAWSWGYFSSTYEAPSTTRVNDEICFRPFIEPSTGDQSYTVSVEGDENRYTLTTKTYTDYSGDHEYTSMICKEVGDYAVTVTSVANPELTNTFTITSLAGLNMDEILVGKYSYGWGAPSYATFTPDTSTEAVDGSVVIESDGKTGTYAYAQLPGEKKATLTLTSGDAILNNGNITWDKDGAISLSTTIEYDWGPYEETYSLTKVEEGAGDDNPGSGIIIY